MTNENPNEDSLEPTILNSNSIQIIYADRILNFGLGSVVSRITLGMEVGQNAFSASATLVIPTTALLDALQHIHKQAHDNPELKELLIHGIQQINEQFTKL